MRILAGGLLQESNTFSTAASTVDDFRRHFYRVGEEMNRPQSMENELTGFQRAAGEEQVELVPTLYTNAVSSGPIARAVLDTLKAALFEQVDRVLPVDGVLFALHGAWVAEDSDDADGEIVEALREKVGPDVPIVITLDSHANVTRRMVEHVNALVGYRTFPHVDYADTGYRAARLLFRIVRGEVKPRLRLEKVPMILAAEQHLTYRGPMAELWSEASKGESGDGQGGEGSLATSLFAVQPWLDVEEMGFSVVVVGEDEAWISKEAARLGELAWNKRSEFEVRLYSVDEVLELLKREPGRGPVIISDSADSPGAGSAGDSNAVLARLLELNAQERWTVLLSMVDAAAAREAAKAGVGAKLKLRVGYSISRTVGSPIEIEGVVTAVGDGRFKFGGGHVSGLEAHMGRCAVIGIGRLSLLLMENPTFTGDPAMYRSVGLEPTEADLVLVKSAAQFRAEYESLSDRIYILDTPGASTANLRSLPFRKIPRPMYPFDAFE